MTYFIKQIGEKDCGITALKILLANIYKRKDFLFYPQTSLNEVVSLKEIIRIAKNEGVDLLAYRVSDKKAEIKNLRAKKTLLVFKKDDVLHLIYLKKVRKHRIEILDPKNGLISLKIEEFLTLWNGELVEFNKVRGSEFYLKNKNIISPKVEVGLFIFQLVTYSFFLTGLYFINSNVDFFIPLSLFISFIFSLLLFNYCLMSVMKKTDLKLFLGIYKSEGSLRNKYLKITELKTFLFTNQMSLLSSSLVIIFTLLILGINSYLSIVFSLSIMIFQITFFVFSNKYMIYRKNKIENLESGLFRYKQEEDEKLLDNFKKLNNEVYKFINLNNLRKYLIILIIIIASLFLSSFEGVISLNYVLFHIFSFFYISSNLDKVLSFKENYEKLNYLKSVYFYYSKNY